MSQEEFKIFERQLNREILFSERLRVTLMGGTYLFLFFVFLVLTTLLRSQISDIILNFIPINITSGLFVIFALREFLLKKYIDRLIDGKMFLDSSKLEKMRFINAIGEMSIPTIIMIVFSFYYNTYIVFSTPIVLLYLIMIMLTTLSLNHRISFVAGFVAAVEFIVVVLIFLKHNPDTIDPEFFNQPYIYIVKSVIIFIGGIIAGVISYQLRKRIYNSYAALIERNRIMNLFGQQVSQQIVDELITTKQEIESKRKFVCIMFLDIRGFSSFAEKREPEEIIAYQNEVFGFMIDAITRHNGIINQFLGDGYMATFGAPVSWGNDCQNALNAALEIVEVLKMKNGDKNFSDTKIGIGLHAGYVVAGNVGSEIRKQYSISGNTVILASRIEQLNKIFNSELLISEDVLNKVNNDNLHYESLGGVSIKGREESINIYKILSGSKNVTERV